MFAGRTVLTFRIHPTRAYGGDQVSKLEAQADRTHPVAPEKGVKKRERLRLMCATSNCLERIPTCCDTRRREEAESFNHGKERGDEDLFAIKKETKMNVGKRLEEPSALRAAPRYK